MSEQIRSSVTPIGKSGNKNNKVLVNTFRFKFTLSDPNQDSCTVIDYGSAVRSEERKRQKKRREAKDKKPNGILEAPIEDDDEDVRRLARKLEEKYGDKKGKSKSYAELGAGYDETDPFIDNTEVCDEVLQEDQETPHGGYYVNCGPLQLKRVEVSDQSDADEVGKRKHKKVLPVIEEDEEKTKDEEEEEAEEEIQADAKPTSVEEPNESKNTKVYDDGEEREEKKSRPIVFNNGTEDPVKKFKKRLISDDADCGNVKIKKAKTVKTLLEEKRTQEPSLSEEPKKQPANFTSISEAIESVVNAGNHDENSNSSNTSHSVSSSASEGNSESKPSSQVTPPPLPENMTPELLSLVEQIKRTAAATDNTRKTFHPDINNCLIKVEWKSKHFSTVSRNALFGHVACYLPCTKDTLMKRAKKLFIMKEESQIETVVCKLKATIDATMPSLLEKHAKECQKVVEEQNLPVSPSNGGTVSKENQQTPDSPSVKLPKRKFPWTEETRGYLREIVRLKNRCYRVLRPRKSSNEDYIRTFLQSKICLWPQGWMKISMLLKESSRSPVSGRSKHSSSHQSDAPRLNSSTSYPQHASNTSTPQSPYMSTLVDTSHQPLLSPLTSPTPLAAKLGDTPNLPLNRPKSPDELKMSLQDDLHNNKTERPEFSMDCLLKRTSESVKYNEYNTTLSDLIKQDSVILNGASLPLKNVNSTQKSGSSRSENVLNLSSCNSSVNGTPSVIQSLAINERTMMRGSDSVSLSTNTSSGNRNNNHNHVYSPTSTRKETVISGNDSSPSKLNQDLLFDDVMQDLKELNHMSSRSPLDTQHENKNNSYKSSWPHSSKVSQSHSPYQNEFMKHLSHSTQRETSLPATPVSNSPYNRHSISPYENTPYMNEIHKSPYNTSPHAAMQGMPTHTVSPVNKMSQMNQGYTSSMKQHPNTGISSGLPHGYMSQMDYNSESQHLMSMTPNYNYSLPNWPYTGSESQSHQ